MSNFTQGILNSTLIKDLILPQLSPYDIRALKIAHHSRLIGGDITSQIPRDMGGITKSRRTVRRMDRNLDKDHLNDKRDEMNPMSGRFGRDQFTQPPNVPFGVIREHPNFYNVNLDRGETSGEANEQILNLY